LNTHSVTQVENVEIKFTLPTLVAERSTLTRTNRSQFYQLLKLHRISGSHFKASWARFQNTHEGNSFSQQSPKAIHNVRTGRDEYDIRELTPDLLSPEFYA